MNLYNNSTLWDLVQSGQVNLNNLSGTPEETDTEKLAQEAEVNADAAEAAADTTAENVADTQEASTEAEGAAQEAAASAETAEKAASEAEASADKAEEAAETATEATEEITTTEDSSGDEVVQTQEELETAILETEEIQEERDELDESIDKNEEAVLATERLLQNIEMASTRGGMNIIHADLCRESLNYIASSVGLPNEAIPQVDISRESFSTAAGVELTTESTKAQVKDMLSKMMQAIINAVAYGIDLIKKLYTRVFVNYDKLEKYAAKLKADLAKSPNFVGKEITNASLAKALTIEGKVVDGVTAAAVLRDAVKEVTQKWLPEKICTTAAEGLKKPWFFQLDKLKETTSSLWGDLSKIIKTDLATIKQCMPFLGNSIPGHVATEKFGYKSDESQDFFVSPALPGNKQVLIVLPQFKEMRLEGTSNIVVPRAVVKFATTNKENGGNKLTTLNKGQAAAVLTAVEEVIKEGKKLKDRMAKAEYSLKLIKATASNLTTTSKAADFSSNFVKGESKDKHQEKAAIQRAAATTLRNYIVYCSEPGASMAAYVLFEAKSLLDLVNVSLSSKGGDKGVNAELPAPKA